MSEKENEKIKLIAFYQQAWGRFFYLRHEILRAEAEEKAVGENIAERIFIEALMVKLKTEFEALSKILEAKKYLHE